MTPSIHQIEMLRRIGVAVDELELRSEAAGRSIDASREHRRRLHERARKIDDELERMRGGTDEAKKLRQERSAIDQQVAAAQRQESDTQAKREELIAYLAPWRETLTAALRHLQLPHESIGIAFGDSSRSASPRSEPTSGSVP